MLLADIVAAFDTDGVELPERQFITTGIPTGICDALIVSWSKVFIGITGFAETPVNLDAGRTRVATFTVDLFRCGYPEPMSTGGRNTLIDPSPAQYSAYAAVVMTDAYVLHRGVQRAFRTGSLRDYKDRVRLGPALPVQPQGGIAGVSLELDVSAL